MAIAAFDIIETGEVLGEILDLVPEPPVNENFEAIGFESVYFLDNLGSFGLMLATYFVLFIIWVLLWPMESRSKWLDKRR